MDFPWDDTFDTGLRKHLKLLPAGAALGPGSNLVELGLDSLEMVSLLVRLEEDYGIVFPDDELTFETFRDPVKLWTVVSGLRAAGPEAA